MAGQVVVENNTGSALHFIGCGSPFQVWLTSDTVHPTPVWPMCAGDMTIPEGESTYPVSFIAAYPYCTNGPPEPSIPACGNDGHAALPPGDYEATLFQSPELVPAPPTIKINVTS